MSSDLNGKGVRRSRPNGVWKYRTRVNGKRVQVSTGTRDKKEAERIAADAIKKVKAKQVLNGKIKSGPMRFFVACAKWLENNPDLREGGLEPQIDWLKSKIGDKYLHLIDGDDIMTMRNKRIRTVRRGKGGTHVPVAPATVNKTLRLMSRVMNHAAFLGAEVRRFKWSEFFLDVPKRKKRGLSPEIEDRIFSELRDDYHPIVEFGAISGLRATELLIRWEQIDWRNSMLLDVTGKGHRAGRDVALSPAEIAILEVESRRNDRHPVYVFTYVADRTRKIGRTDRSIVAGRRYPITYTGWKERWKAMREAIGLPKIRIHDLRHTAANRALARSGNLKAVQEILGHSTIAITSAFYADASDDMVRNAKQTERGPHRGPKQSKMKVIAGAQR